MTLAQSNRKDIVNQLVWIYFTEEKWHKDRLTPQDAIEYHEYLLERDRIIYVEEEGMVVGYVESWRVDSVGLHKILIEDDFSPFCNDIEHGELCYVANMWIANGYRGRDTMKKLNRKFQIQNSDCTHIIGHETGNGNRLRCYKNIRQVKNG